MTTQNTPHGQFVPNYPALEHIPWEIQAQMTKTSMRLYGILCFIYHKSSNPITGNTNCRPGYAYLAEKLGVCVRSIHNAVHKLKALGLIDHKHRWCERTRRYLTNLYYLPKVLFQVLRTCRQTKVLNNFRMQENASQVVKLTNNLGDKVGKPPISGGLPPIKKEMPTFTHNEWLEHLKTFKRNYL